MDYTAKFKLGNDSYKSYYKIDGTWDYTVNYLTESDYPKAFKSAVNKSCISEWGPILKLTKK